MYSIAAIVSDDSCVDPSSTIYVDFVVSTYPYHIVVTYVYGV